MTLGLAFHIDAKTIANINTFKTIVISIFDEILNQIFRYELIPTHNLRICNVHPMKTQTT